MLRELRGMLAVAATYIYFLLYAQFGFLELAQRVAGRAGQVETVMLAMGLAGLLSSLGTAVLLRRHSSRALLCIGFSGCALTAAGAAVVDSFGLLLSVAILIGLFTGLLTVALATDVRALLGGTRVGLQVGVATGIAYLFCNVPQIFEAAPATQAGVAAAICLLALSSVAFPQPPAPPERVSSKRPALHSREFAGAAFVCVVVWFLGLIWLDSAGFAVIQQTPELKLHTWAGVSQKWLLGLLHLAAAALAGHLLDRGRFFSLLLAAFGAFGAAFVLLDRASESLQLAAPLYVVAVSLYSVALVVYPSMRPAGAGLVPPRWRAAILFGVAGWIGSALGIGMVQDLHRVPLPFLAATGGAMLVGWSLAHGFAPWRRLIVYRGTSLFAVGAIAMLLLQSGASDSAAPASAALRGRAVYIQEGCINCHSQFVRPGTADVESWGPAREIDLGQEPPLIGMRRQGPDLMNVGNRRNAEWQKIHLISPRLISPGSRMPSYAHLFADGDRRGDDLIVYLSSLGAESKIERDRYTQSLPLPETLPASATRGARLFDELCAGCHGSGARGDGPIGRELRRPSMNLLKQNFWLISWGAGAESEDRALARLIKFGVPGTTMAGHESLSSQELADIVSHLQRMRQRASSLAASAR